MMKQKSNQIDYDHIFRILLIIFTSLFLYIFLQYFLVLSNGLSIFLLLCGVLFLVAYFFYKEKTYLFLAFGSVSLCLASSLVFLYVLPLLKG